MNSAIFLFPSALCSTMQFWVWLACLSNLCAKDLELTPYFSSASQNTLFSVSLPQPMMTTPSPVRPDSLETIWRLINYLLTYLLTLLVRRFWIDSADVDSRSWIIVERRWRAAFTTVTQTAKPYILYAFRSNRQLLRWELRPGYFWNVHR